MQGKILFLPLHRFSKAIGLSHGVMVALQFLVLSVEVRILVRQLNNPERGMSIVASLFYFVTFSRIDSLGSPDKPGGLSIQLCKSEKKEFYIRYSS